MKQTHKRLFTIFGIVALCIVGGFFLLQISGGFLRSTPLTDAQKEQALIEYRKKLDKIVIGNQTVVSEVDVIVGEFKADFEKNSSGSINTYNEFVAITAQEIEKYIDVYSKKTMDQGKKELILALLGYLEIKIQELKKVPSVSAYVTGEASSTNATMWTNKAKKGTTIQLHYSSKNVTNEIAAQIFQGTGPLNNSNLVTGTPPQYAGLSGNTTESIENIQLGTLSAGKYRIVVTGCLPGATLTSDCVSTPPVEFEVIEASQAAQTNSSSSQRNTESAMNISSNGGSPAQVQGTTVQQQLNGTNEGGTDAYGSTAINTQNLGDPLHRCKSDLSGTERSDDGGKTWKSSGSCSANQHCDTSREENINTPSCVSNILSSFSEGDVRLSGKPLVGPKYDTNTTLYKTTWDTVAGSYRDWEFDKCGQGAHQENPTDTKCVGNEIDCPGDKIPAGMADSSTWKYRWVAYTTGGAWNRDGCERKLDYNNRPICKDGFVYAYNPPRDLPAGVVDTVCVPTTKSCIIEKKDDVVSDVINGNITSRTISWSANGTQKFSPSPSSQNGGEWEECTFSSCLTGHTQKVDSYQKVYCEGHEL